LEDHAKLVDAIMALVYYTSSLDSPICNSQSGHHIRIDRVILATVLPVGIDIAAAVVKQRTSVVSWCGALTNSCSANSGSGLTEVGGVLLVVIHRSECLFG
jgi:hypothetical protein